MPFRRVVRQVLHELPIVAFRIVEVNANPMRMRDQPARLLVARRNHPLAQRAGIVHLEPQMVQTGTAGIRIALQHLAGIRRIERDICIVDSNMDPPLTIRIDGILTNLEFGKRRPQEFDDGVDVVHAKICMFESYGHWTFPLRLESWAIRSAESDSWFRQLVMMLATESRTSSYPAARLTSRAAASKCETPPARPRRFRRLPPKCWSASATPFRDDAPHNSFRST